MSGNPRRQPALTRIHEAHPAATAAAAAAGGEEGTSSRSAAPPAPPTPPPAPAETPTPTREGTTQLNVRVPVSLRSRAEIGALTVSAQEGRRVPLQELVITAIDEYLSRRQL